MSVPLPSAEEVRLKALPKAEVHLHLEGRFEAALIAQWAKTEGVALPRPQEDLFKFSGLADFLGFLDLAYTQDRLGAMLDAIHAGFAAAEQDGLPCVGLLRTQSADAAIELVETLTTLRHPRVVALSVDGNEATAGRTDSRFAEAFRKAGNPGLRRTVYAGESSRPERVWDAVELLGADRIDHGVRAIEDSALVQMLADLQIPLGLCPTSGGVSVN